MTTTLNTLYPPQVETFMPSFCYNDSAKIWFNISSYDEDRISQIKFIHISMVNQENNTNVFAGIGSNNTTVYPQYYPVQFFPNNTNEASNNIRTGYDNNKKMYWVSIPPQVLKTYYIYNNVKYHCYNTNQYYKIQLRFDLTGDSSYPAYNNTYNNPTTFFPWNGEGVDAIKLSYYTDYNENNFSEWSTGTLIKPILIPDLSIQQLKSGITNNIKPSTDTLISGFLKFNRAVGDGDTVSTSNERLSWYQIKIIKNSSIIYNSNKLYSDNGEEYYTNIDTSMLVSINNNYQLQFTYETEHGYNQTILYTIAVDSYGNNLTNEEYSIIKDEENGIITLNIVKANHPNNSILIIRRSSHYSDFTKWDLIHTYKFPILEDSIIINDNTIESMTGYRYQLQYINGNTMYAPQRTEIIHCDFYGGLFSDSDGKILKISFNFEPSNRINASNRTKTDTLGGKYPVFTQNPKLKYHTYNISGRISTEDNGELFLSKEELFGLATDLNSYYTYRYNPTITPSTISSKILNINTLNPHNAECQGIKPNQDWLYEREYRDAVEEWLNNGKPKLFRSMTEGNMIVMLDGVSMTPDTVLGRRLYDFSATMYEIGDGKNLDSIASFGLLNVVND